MLIRIAPQMFLDEAYQCCTITEIRNEIYQTQKFKNKYPWRDKYKDRIKHLSLSADKKRHVDEYLSTIDLLLDNHIINEYNGKTFDLSRVDRIIIATALACGHKISSTDNALLDFAEQQFPDDFQGYILPLGLLNLWLGKKLVSWSDDLEQILSEWKAQNEPQQMRQDKSMYHKLTHKKYPGL
jgi:hypothetical protein